MRALSTCAIVRPADDCAQIAATISWKSLKPWGWTLHATRNTDVSGETRTVPIGRVIASLLAGGLALMAAGVMLYGTAAHAASPREREVPPFQYTSNPARVAAFRQWNYVLNGFIRFDGRLLPENASRSQIEQIRYHGGWVVARVDSTH